MGAANLNIATDCFMGLWEIALNNGISVQANRFSEVGEIYGVMNFSSESAPDN